MMTLVYMFLAASVPYYVILQKNDLLSSKAIFALSLFLLLASIWVAPYVATENLQMITSISIISAFYSFYRAIKTTNFYKLGYYLVFINAPMYLLFAHQSMLYAVSLVVSLSGLYLIGRFYENYYGSANYHHITGIMATTPIIGTFLTIYLITIALYPPLPNALFFLNTLFSNALQGIHYVVVTLLFFANFFLAMRVMSETLFGQANKNIHYADLHPKEFAAHIVILLFLTLLSFYGLKEVLS